MLIEVLAVTWWFRLRRNAVLRFYVDFDCAGSRNVGVPNSQFRRHRFTGCSCTFSDMNFILHGRCKEAFTCGGQKREFTWQVQGIGHVVKIVAGAVFRGRCQNVGRRVSFEGLRFTWQAQGIRTYMF